MTYYPIMTAFFAAGKRLTVDLKILNWRGQCLYKLQIDEESVEKFIHAWDTSYEEFRQALIDYNLEWFYQKHVKYKFELLEYHEVETLAGLASLSLVISRQW